MPKIHTLGSLGKRTWFQYEGSVKEGTTILFTGNPFISSELYRAALSSFSGKTIKGGFSMTDPPSGGFGEWVKENSSMYGRRLTPRHGSFIAAILVSEGYIDNSLDGNSVILHFPEHKNTLGGDDSSEVTPSLKQFEKCLTDV